MSQGRIWDSHSFTIQSIQHKQNMFQRGLSDIHNKRGSRGAAHAAKSLRWSVK